MTDEKMMVEYKAQSGDLIKLTMTMVRNYLVSGKKELVTMQELVYFMHTCKARKLNPFIKDCYLVKYTERDPAAIITSVDYFRKNARKQPDCRGWKCGIIVKGKNGQIYFPTGSFITEDQELVGGWASAKPDGWNDEFMHTVNLIPYIKKTREGHPTQFWQRDKQPEMIMKVAEAQLLRKLWGEEATGMYTPEEMVTLENAEITAPPDTSYKVKDKADELDKATGHKEHEPEPPPVPTPNEANWDPYTSPVQGRYGADKLEILKAALEAEGIQYQPSWTGRQLHEALITSKGVESEPKAESSEDVEAAESEQIRRNIKKYLADPKTKAIAEKCAQELKIANDPTVIKSLDNLILWEECIAHARNGTRDKF
jgi:phage recombination protein Bet